MIPDPNKAIPILQCFVWKWRTKILVFQTLCVEFLRNSEYKVQPDLIQRQMCLHINLVHLYFGSAFGSIDNSETSFFWGSDSFRFSVFQWLVWCALYYSYKVVWAGTRWYLMVHGVMEGISWQWYVLLVYKCHCWMEYISRSRLSICLSFYSFMFQVKLLIWNETRRWPINVFFLDHFPPINLLICQWRSASSIVIHIPRVLLI